jgi:trans-aconitate 2-methyltransferase
LPWDPDCYQRFQPQRYAPFEDLVRHIRVREALRVVDLGCGTGELTARLAAMLPSSEVVGLDSSPAMLERAQKFHRPGLSFQEGSMETLGGTWDLVFSHAAIHWVDDHRRLVPSLYDHVNPGGQLVLQFPSNHAHPVHGIIRETAGAEPFLSALGGPLRPSPVLPLEVYGEMLHQCGARGFLLLEKIYPHLLEDAEALLLWLLGTTLVPTMERLPQKLHEPFRRALLERFKVRWPGRPVYFGFKRTLLAADRPLEE